MPNISVVVVETKQSILRPVVLDIVRQILEITKIPVTTPILYPDDVGQVAQPGSTIDPLDNQKNIFPNNDKVTIEVDEEFDPANILSSAVFKTEHNPVFHDTDIGTYIKPVYSSNMVSINFKYKTKSKSMAERWKNDIQHRTSAGRDINLHQVSYHFIIPVAMVNIVKEIHRLREAVDGYNETFAKYFQNKSTQRLTEVTDQGGTFVQPAIAETQKRIVGQFNFAAAPEKIENDEDGSGWIGSFTYTFKYDKAIACNMKYPVMIHNQILSERYRPSEGAYDLDDHPESNSESFNSMRNFEAQLQAGLYSGPDLGIVLPSFDEFTPSSIPSGTVSVFSALCQLSATDKRNLLNLKQLGEIKIQPDILEFIEKSEYPFMTRPYRSILQVDLYRRNALVTAGSIEITPQLDVLGKEDFSLRINHRVRFSIVANLDLLSPEAIGRLKLYPKALVAIIAAINESLRNNPGFMDLKYSGYITRDDIYKYITNPQDRNNRIQFNTVQLSEVIALRAEDLNN
jgi:hypothetical protein